MLDLSKPLGAIDGLVVFGDHEQADLVYYLPDEVDLRMLAADTPDIALQIFFPDQAVAGGDLGQAVGSILSLGVHCTVSESRKEDVRSRLASQLGRDNLRLTSPPWEDGAVELLLLDTQSGETLASAVKDDRMVRGVVGSRRPSVGDGLLSALFHARLDQRGTALSAAALDGRVGSLAGVLYDLKFLALRPTVDLRMSADLNRCAEFFRAGVGVQIYYVSADISATFGKMREEGVIKVDLVSQAGDPEAERLVNECVKDFYDVLMRELFKPTVPPIETLGGAIGAAPQTSIVKFSFAYSRVEQERVVEVDYRKRSATRRTHNPQAHLRRLATLAGGSNRVIQRVPLSAGWREFSVEIAVPDAFDDTSLKQVRVVLWRGRDAVLDATQARDGGLRMPATVVPLADLAFTKTDAAARRLSWVNEPTEAPFYRWQARFTFAPQDGIDSPAEIWSEPRVASSSDLDLFPEILAPKRRAVLRLGEGHDESLRAIEAIIISRNEQGIEIARTRLAVDRTKPEISWAVRRSEQQRVSLEAALTYRYTNNRVLQGSTQALLERDVFANVPFVKTLTISPLVFGAPATLTEVVLIARYEHAGYRHEEILRLRPPDFRGDDIRIPVLHSNEQVKWEAVAVKSTGETVQVGRGETAGGVLRLQISNERRIRAEWLGPSPAALGLRWARASFRARGDNGQVLGLATVEWRGETVTGEQIVTLPNEGHAEWSLEKRFEDGRRETGPFVPVDGDLVGVVG